MRYFLLAIFCSFLVYIISCNRKDFTTKPSFGNLEFSNDTIFLDTIFTKISSATHTLKVYNRSNNDITIPIIKLENGQNSMYRINVDGTPGKEFNDIDILEKDSIFIFIETTIDHKSTSDPLYIDKILFDVGNNQQDVNLVTLVQDANFIYPHKNPTTMKIENITLDDDTTLKGRFLTDKELTFTSSKPTVIYGFAVVPSDKTLIIEAGAKVYFHDSSGLVIDNNATLKVKGTLEEKVVFEGDRLDYKYKNIPGQWDAIWLKRGSENNEITHAQIKNGTIGLWVEGNNESSVPTVKLESTELYNHSNYGILARETHIEANNVVIGNAGQISLAATMGGTYNFTHSTFANYWNNGIRNSPAVLINNYYEKVNDNNEKVVETRNLNDTNFTNCIFYGNSNIELVINRLDLSKQFEYSINNCLIKFDDINNKYQNNELLDFENPTYYQNIILSGIPDFRNTEENDFIIGQNSESIKKGISTGKGVDILGMDRTDPPDIGAYQHIIFKD